MTPSTPPPPRPRSLASIAIGLVLTALHLLMMAVTCGVYVTGPTIFVMAAKALVLAFGGPEMIAALIVFYGSMALLLALPPLGIVLANLRWTAGKVVSALFLPVCVILLAGEWAVVRQVNPAPPDRPSDDRVCTRFSGDMSANGRACHVEGEGVESPDCPEGMWCNLIQPTQNGHCEIHCSYSCECPSGWECTYGEWCRP